MRSISIGGIDLDVDVGGSGEPVVFIQTALVADEFVPLASQPRLRDEYQTILYHRRGYGNSSPTEVPARSNATPWIVAICSWLSKSTGLILSVSPTAPQSRYS